MQYMYGIGAVGVGAGRIPSPPLVLPHGAAPVNPKPYTNTSYTHNATEDTYAVCILGRRIASYMFLRPEGRFRVGAECSGFGAHLLDGISSPPGPPEVHTPQRNSLLWLASP